MNATRTKLVGLGLVIFAVALWLYWPCVEGGFLNGDDEEYLQQAVRWNGLTWNAVKWAFTSGPAFYQPLAHLSHVLDYQIWGRNAAGHHATNVVLHALNAVLVFGFVWTLLGAPPLATGERLMVSLGVAVVFAIHPLHVESVAWTSDRPTLVCATFGIGSVWAYAAGARRWTVWGLYVAALLCKPTAVSLPFAMLAIDYFPLRRHEQLGWGRLVREKAVWIALAAAVGVATMLTESHARTLVPLKEDPLLQRVWVMFQGLAFYAWKLVWPGHLLLYYPLRSGLSLSQWPVLMSLVGVVTITALAVWGQRRLPALAAGWFAYVMLVLPVSGLTQTGSQLVALRYAYVVILPPLLLVGGSAVWVWRRSTTTARLALIGLLACDLCVFGVCARSLIPDWHDDVALWRAVLADFPDLEGPHQYLAQILLKQGKAEEALVYAQRDAQIAPQLCWSHITLGNVFSRLGRLPEAIEQYEQALRIEPNIPQAHNNLGYALYQMGRVQEAVEQYEQALRIKPDYAEAHFTLGIAMAQAGRAPEAREHYEQALRIRPDYAEAHYNLGNVFLREGKFSDAIGHYEQALRIKPDYADAHNNLGLALSQMGKTQDAIGHYQQALRIKPDYTEAQNSLARLLATRPAAEGGDPVRAIALAQEACERAGNRVATYLDTLAAAYAAAGRFHDASATAEKAIELARSGGQPNLARRIEARLELYRSGHAYRQSVSETEPQTP